MRQVVAASVVYFAIVFAAAFLLGALRVTVIIPRVGALAAVALEVPIVLSLSWIVAGAVLRRWPLGTEQRMAMGLVAFAVLMVAEFVLATLGFGQTAATYLAAMATPHGALGLAGQIGFALVPVLRR